MGAAFSQSGARTQFCCSYSSMGESLVELTGDTEQGAPASQGTPDSESTLGKLETVKGRLTELCTQRKSAVGWPPDLEKLQSHQDAPEEQTQPPDSNHEQLKQPDFDAKKIIESLQGIQTLVGTLRKDSGEEDLLLKNGVLTLQKPFSDMFSAAAEECIKRGEVDCFAEFCKVLPALLDAKQIRSALKLCIEEKEVACLKVFCNTQSLQSEVDNDCILKALRAGRHNKEIASPVLDVMSEGTKEDHKLTLMCSGDMRTIMRPCETQGGPQDLKTQGGPQYLKEEFEAEYSWFEHIWPSLEAACHVYKLRPALLCSTEVLRALAEVPGQSTWQTLAARAVIAHAWNYAFPLFCFDMGLCAFRLWLLVWLTYKMHHLQFPPLAVWTLCVATGCDFCLALLNLIATVCFAWRDGETTRQKNRRPFAGLLRRVHIYNFFCVGVVVFEGIACYKVSQGLRKGLQNRLTLATWVACKWLHFAWHLRGTRLVGKRMLPVVYALGDVAGFLIVCLFALIAAIHMYYVLGDKGSFDVLKFDFDVVYRLVVLQDFENDELHSTNRSLELGIQIFFYVVSASLSIILMNLLIGVLGNNYDRYADRGEELCMRGRAAILSKYLSFPLFKRMISLEGDSDDKKELRIIVAEKPMDTKVEEERSVRTVVEKEMEKMRSELNKMHAEMDQIRKLHAIADNPEGPQRRLEADIWRKLRHIIKGLPNVKDTKRGDKIGQELGLLQEDGNSDSGEEEDALPGGKSYKDRKGITSPHHC
mmetsp:Transcript_53442/g.127450  ORF Transcript_53442/g.127450 Transcript_53442/m.127450 type:complete len:760 (+) Transcript_53442:82-2361(+)